MTNNIEAILFDMGGTLRGTRNRTREERLKYTGEILKLLGSEENPAKFSRLLSRRSTAYRHWARETMIELNEADLWTRWMLPEWPEQTIRAKAMKLNLLWRDATGERIVFPETAEVVISLFQRGYRLGLVSNTTSSTEAPDALEKLGLTGYFETMVLSAVVGKRKPDPAILLNATNLMGVSPENCAYIGDIPNRDVAAARKAEFSQTVLIHKSSGRKKRPSSIDGLEPDHHISNLKDLLKIFPSRIPPQPKYVFNASVSSMWGMGNFHSLSDFMEASRRIGFRRVELNHQVDSKMLKEITRGGLTFSSVHEPCPADISASEYKKRDWLISSTNDKYRLEGVKSIQRSIDLASELGATYIVVHAGNVHQDQSMEEQMRRLVNNGYRDSQEFVKMKSILEKRRRDLAPPRFDALIRSLRELLEYAGHFGIALGLENRSHYLEMPVPDELGQLLILGTPSQIGFIYDVGHAQALSMLGFFSYDEWLRRFANRIIGTHMHDVIGFHDHKIPGQGEVDFGQIRKFLPVNAIRTLEFQGPQTEDKVIAGLSYLNKNGCIQIMNEKR
jgi:HAD superfamily hydrolase (TIGR01549 family)